MKEMPLILVVEDEAEIADILIAYLNRDGFRTLHAENGEAALRLHREHTPALAILDIRMPGIDGWQVLTEIRRQDATPVLMLTANDGDADKLSALRIGADDYVVKPFNPAEVVARVQAILRRSLPQQAQPRGLSNGWLELFPDEHRVVVMATGQDIAATLTSTEFRILAYMIAQPKKVFSRQEILDVCRPEGDALQRTVDSHISKLRRKLEEAGINGMPESVRGFGYRLGA